MDKEAGVPVNGVFVVVMTVGVYPEATIPNEVGVSVYGNVAIPAAILRAGAIIPANGLRHRSRTSDWDNFLLYSLR
jgi:hypothetical protein